LLAGALNECCRQPVDQLAIRDQILEAANILRRVLCGDQVEICAWQIPEGIGQAAMLAVILRQDLREARPEAVLREQHIVELHEVFMWQNHRLSDQLRRMS
jgi:hypothetical protein